MSMYAVDLDLWNLVSCMRIMCGFVCSVCERSWIPGRLEFMQPVFHVIIFRVVAWWFWVFVCVGGLWCFGIFMLGWYPLTGCVHFCISYRIVCRMYCSFFVG